MNLRKRLSLGQRIRRDKITDMRELAELVAFEQRQWGPRMRVVKSLGEPVMGLGFAGVVVPNNEVITAPASVSYPTAETNLYTNASTGQSTFMWIPPGNFRAPQSWRVWAGGTFSTQATTSTITWITRVGASAAASANASIGVTGSMAPGSPSGAIVTAAPWWYEAHLTVRSPGTAGTMIGMFTIELAAQSPAINTATGVGSTGSTTATLDTTQGAYWDIAIAGASASPTTGAQLQQMTIVAWD